MDPVGAVRPLKARSATTPASTRPRTTLPVFHVSGRHDAQGRGLLRPPLWGRPPTEDYYLGGATERIFLPLLRLTMPEIVDYHMPAEGIFHNLVFV